MTTSMTSSNSKHKAQLVMMRLGLSSNGEFSDLLVGREVGIFQKQKNLFRCYIFTLENVKVKLLVSVNIAQFSQPHVNISEDR